LTALHWAAAADYLKTIDSVRADRRRVIDLLIAAGAKVDAPGPFGWTPLRSNWMGLEDVTAALIAHGADVNAQDEDGFTPLMTNNSVGAVRLLLRAGANPYLRNGEGKNALEVARGDIFAEEVATEIERWVATYPPRAYAK
jgi:ankyrin repeat protein